MSNSSFWLKAGVAAAALTIPAVSHAAPYRFHYDHVLGTSLDITAVAENETAALMAASAVDAEISRLDRVLSAWRADGALAQLNGAESAAVSPELFQVLASCEAWRQTTDGAFDCRVGEPLRLWRAAAETGTPVEASRLDAAVAAARGEVGLHRDSYRVVRPQGVTFTVDGMAKGYVIDAAMQAARRAAPGVSGLMIDIGGDLRCWGRGPAGADWRVGVAATGDADNTETCLSLRVSDRAMAASGRGQRDLRVQGCAVSHILSAASGQPVADVTRAVVVAPAAADADALATAFMAMTPTRAMALARKLDGVEAMVTDADGADHVSDGWRALAEPTAPRTIDAAYVTALGDAAALPTTQGFSLDLGYQVPRIDADSYHAPYVAAWITDGDHKMVRNILLLGQKPRWVTENYVWWRRYGRATPEALDAVAKPTRMPGRYTAHWDGKDEAGHAAPPGHYILHVEAAREKGGHTYETVDFDLGGAGGAKTVPAKDEIGALEVRYGSAH